MGLRINGNVTATSAGRQLSRSTEELNNSRERLSSGLRLNRASDDTSSLVATEGSQANVRGSQVSRREARDCISKENSAASESDIRDADIAKETIQFTRNQILVSANTSILAQANVVPQSALTLLG